MAATDNTAQLRHDIDSGKTGDRSPALDPAAAPLGTDEEAAGTPPSGETVRETRIMENRSHIAADQNSPSPSITPQGAPTRPMGSMAQIMILASVIVLGIGAIAFTLMI